MATKNNWYAEVDSFWVISIRNQVTTGSNENVEHIGIWRWIRSPSGRPKLPLCPIPRGIIGGNSDSPVSGSFAFSSHRLYNLICFTEQSPALRKVLLKYHLPLITSHPTF